MYVHVFAWPLAKGRVKIPSIYPSTIHKPQIDVLMN